MKPNRNRGGSGRNRRTRAPAGLHAERIKRARLPKWVGIGWAVAAAAGFLIYWTLIRGEPGVAISAQPDRDQVSRGGVIYASSCASCHGARGEGSPNWRTRNPDGTLNPPPHDETGHTWHHSDGQLIMIIRDGGQVYASAGFISRMPGFGAHLSESEIRDVLAYLKSLWPPEERRFQAEASKRDPLPR